MNRSRTRGTEEKTRADDFVKSASALFAKRGFDRTSVREIAQALGVASGTLFYHFESKEDLLEAIINKGIADGYQRASEALADTPLGPLSRLLALASSHIEVVHGELRHVHQVWIREWGRLSPKAQERMRPTAHKYRDLLDSVLVEVQQAGYLKTDPTMTRHLMLPALNWTISWSRASTNTARRNLARQLCAASLNLPLESFLTLLKAEHPQT
ncbi:TetR/AcrR family transcriptional regulator [Tsuneonella sp. HG094]